MRADPELEVELGVCHHFRIRHSEFLGWSPDDRDKAIWTWLRDRQTCAQCGTRPDEWDPDRGGHRRAYLAQIDVCRGCQAIDQRSKALTDEQRQPGMQVVLRKQEVTRGEQA